MKTLTRNLDLEYTGKLLSYEEIKKRFSDTETWGLLACLDLHHCNPETIRSPEAVREYVNRLCDLIKMKKFGECTVVHFGEDERVSGLSMTQLIETSLISGHFANQTNAAYIDIFSCALYNPYEAAEFSRHFFSASDYNLYIHFRK
ncbi:MAG: S-adenosylmethionine decarboxylase [Spirochaetales bacterium]|nr:S-adenosylmethionine decarboxylase [Spirochaetales bacterium]